MIEIGEIFRTNTSGDIEVVNIKNSRQVTVKFIETGNITVAAAYNIRNGKVQDHNATVMRKTRYNVGYTGIGPYSHSTHKNYYDKWSNMLQRCYSEDMKRREPSYSDCICCLDWQCFQNFAQWCEENCTNQSYSLDKDILVKHNKLYSPNTCCFVPNLINKVFVKQRTQRGLYPIGVRKEHNHDSFVAVCTNPFTKKVDHFGGFKTSEEAFYKYKEHKESIIKQLAILYKNKIADNVYQAMMNYQVEITD